VLVSHTPLARGIEFSESRIWPQHMVRVYIASYRFGQETLGPGNQMSGLFMTGDQSCLRFYQCFDQIARAKNYHIRSSTKAVESDEQSVDSLSGKVSLLVILIYTMGHRLTLRVSCGSFDFIECSRVLARLSISSIKIHTKVFSSSSSIDSIVPNSLLTALPLSLKYLLNSEWASISTSLHEGSLLPRRMESC